jgi:uncharacterized membrane protein
MSATELRPLEEPMESHRIEVEEDHEETSAAADNRVSKVLDRNISALLQQQTDEDRKLGLQDRMANWITKFAGSMLFVYIHLIVFGLWIAINLAWLPVVPPWDASLVVLAMAASVEAIFISTFVLISQNRMAENDDKRADLNLQISLLNEHETTKLIAMVSAIAERLDARSEVSSEEIKEMKANVPPEIVLEEIERRKDE